MVPCWIAFLDKQPFIGPAIHPWMRQTPENPVCQVESAALIAPAEISDRGTLHLQT